MRIRMKNSVHVYEKVASSQLNCAKAGKSRKSRARQEFRDSANINKIIARHGRTGVLSSGDVVNERSPMYGDYENIDYVETANKIAKLEQDFMRQPSEIRAICENDPKKWLTKMETDERIAAENKVKAEAAAKAEADKANKEREAKEV